MSEHRIDTGARFAKLILTPEEDTLACQSASPLFLAFLQNKIASYAEQLVLEDFDFDPDPTKQVKAIKRITELKAQITVLEELRDELIDGQQRASGK